MLILMVILTYLKDAKRIYHKHKPVRAGHKQLSNQMAFENLLFGRDQFISKNHLNFKDLIFF